MTAKDRGSDATSPATHPMAAAPQPRVTEDVRITVGLEELINLLAGDERLEAYSVQRRAFALWHRRMIVAATTDRFIALARGLLGGFTVLDVPWQHLAEADMHAGTLAASLTITSLASEDFPSRSSSGSRMTFGGLRKREAQQVYRSCQTQTQAWRERRVAAAAADRLAQ